MKYSIFIKLSMALAVMCVILLFLVDFGSTEFYILLVTLALNAGAIAGGLIAAYRRRKRDEGR